MKKRKLLASMLNNPQQVRFVDLLAVAIWLGFVLDRISGSHHILIHKGTGTVLNLQSKDGQAKPYQVRQFLKLAEQHRLSPQEPES